MGKEWRKSSLHERDFLHRLMESRTEFMVKEVKRWLKRRMLEKADIGCASLTVYCILPTVVNNV